MYSVTVLPAFFVVISEERRDSIRVVDVLAKLVSSLFHAAAEVAQELMIGHTTVATVDCMARRTRRSWRVQKAEAVAASVEFGHGVEPSTYPRRL